MKDKQQYRGMWVEPISMNDKELARLIGHSPGDQTFEKCRASLVSAAKLQQVVSASQPSNTLTELKNQLSSMEKAFKRINSALAELDGFYEPLLDQYYYLANNRDGMMMEKLPRNGGSRFYTVAERMGRTIEYFQQELQEPGKGNRENKSYTFALQKISAQFIELFPNHKISAERGALFHKLVIFWLHECVGTTDIVDASRHIETLIKSTPTD